MTQALNLVPHQHTRREPGVSSEHWLVWPTPKHTRNKDQVPTLSQHLLFIFPHLTAWCELGHFQDSLRGLGVAASAHPGQQYCLQAFGLILLSSEWTACGLLESLFIVRFECLAMIGTD